MIVAVDEGKVPGIGLEEALAGAEALRQALGQGLGFEDVQVVSGERAHPREIRAAVQQAAGKPGDGPGVLLVAWLGHGFGSTHEEEQRLLTYYSQPTRTDELYNETFSSSDLSSLLRDHQREGLESALVVDACRVPIAGVPTGSFERLAAAARVVCSSAAAGQAAQVPRDLGMPLFTSLLCDALAASGGARVSLLDALDEARRRTEARTRSQQTPEILTGDADLLLVDRANLTIQVEPTSGPRQRPLDGATVLLDGRTGELDPATGLVTFRGLRAGTTLELTVEAPFHWPRREFVDMEPARDGLVRRVPLAPRHVLVEGQVRHDEDEAVEVAVSGDFGEALVADYHLVAARPDEEGRFRLLLPPSDGRHSVLVRVDGQVVRSAGIDLSRGLEGSDVQSIALDSFSTPGFDEAQVTAVPQPPAEASPRRTAPPSGPAPTLEVLRDREAYARLGESQVLALARAAERHWRQQFTGFTFSRVERFEAGGAAHWMGIWEHRATGLEFVLVPGGTFRMGSPSGEGGRNSDETQHTVTVSAYLIARTECTQAAWARVAGKAGLDARPSHFSGNDLPVESVSWTEVEKWCGAAGLMLPTEAQWEYGCRAGTSSAYAFGTSVSDRQARSGSSEPVRAGRLAANAFGLHDVHGNVWEWCRDWYLDYSERVQSGNGLRLGTSSYRVYRGGSFVSTAGYARSASRIRVEPGYSAGILGFRPALDLP